MNPVHQYFSGEKNESYLFLVLGLLGLVMSVYLIQINTSIFWRGLALPFILVSLLEIIVGVMLIYRSPKDIIRVENFIKNERVKIITDEIPRMEKVMKNFVIFRFIEIGLILTGIIIYFRFTNHDFWRGVGFGLSLQSCIVLLLDCFAEKRGLIYLGYLNSLSNE